MSAGSHDAVDRIGGDDVDHIFKEIGFSVLTTEVLKAEATTDDGIVSKSPTEITVEDMSTYAADNVIMIRQMGFAVLATVYAVRIQVDVVCQPHLCERLA